MSRKLRKGYYVNGEFVVADAKADQPVRGELDDADAPSRTELKHAAERVQEIGEELLALREDKLTKLSLPEILEDAVLDAKRMAKPGAKRRQRQLIGKLMRRLDPEALEAVRTALHIEHSHSAQATGLLRRAERWRDALIADDEMLEQWLKEFPATDAQQLRSFIRQARKDAKETRAGEAQRHGRAYRQIYTIVRSQIRASADTPL